MIEPSLRSALSGLAVLFGALTFWSFGKWTDPVIDFGYDLYVPWRITEGDVLYRDIAYRNGPLSSYWNALLFAVFGVSIRTLVVANLALLLATTALLFALLERVATRYAAMLATALFLLICAFSQYGNVGNYNFVTPYQHGQTHGVWLGLCCVALLGTGLRSEQRAAWIGAGLTAGALFLTKAEVFVPALAASGLAVGLTRHGRKMGAAALWATGAVVFPVIAIVALSTAMPFPEALVASAGNWPYLAGVGVWAADGFYAANAGFGAPGTQLLKVAAACAAAAVLGATASAAGRAAPSARPAWLGIGAIAGFALASLLDLPWEGVGAVLPLGMGIAIAAHSRRALRGDAQAQATLLFAVYALAMLGKLGLRPQVQHYGFALAAPALALGAALALAACRNVASSAVATGVLIAIGVGAWHDANVIYAAKNFELAGTLEQGDSILVTGPERSPRGAAVERALRQLQPLIGVDQSLLVLPEGAGLNYWLRRRSAGPFGLFLPTELAAHGGAAAMLTRIRATPPDFVALVHRGPAGFGTGPFLQDPANGAAFDAWLRSDYQRRSTIGSEPFRGPRFGIVLLERRPSDTSESIGSGTDGS